MIDTFGGDAFVAYRGWFLELGEGFLEGWYFNLIWDVA